MLKEILNIFWITFIPGLELRASIPYGVMMAKMDWLLVFILACVANVLVAVFTWFIMKYVVQLFLHIPWIKRIYSKIVLRSQTKLHPHIEKYGVLGLAIFIGVPLPGTGVYTGGIGAYILGYRFRDYFIASILGVLMAAIIVTIVVVTGNSALNFLIIS